MQWIVRGADGWILNVHAQPGAKRTECAGLHGEALKIRLHAPPVEGKANDELLAFVASAFGVPKSAVALTRGHSSRVKQLRVAGADDRTTVQIAKAFGIQVD